MPRTQPAPPYSPLIYTCTHVGTYFPAPPSFNASDLTSASHRRFFTQCSPRPPSIVFLTSPTVAHSSFSIITHLSPLFAHSTHLFTPRSLTQLFAPRSLTYLFIPPSPFHSSLTQLTFSLVQSFFFSTPHSLAHSPFHSSLATCIHKYPNIYICI